MSFVTRFAPSPTGFLHRGHAFSALSAQAAARAEGGRFLLRVEDIDLTRCRPEYEQGVYDDLAWLGLEWEEPVRRQSAHFDEYRGALDQLIARGLVYRCFKTRREILDEIARAPHGPGEGPEGAIYRGQPLSPADEAALLAEGRPYAWRLSLDRAQETVGGWEALTFTEAGEGPLGETGVIQARPETAGDVVLARKDVGVAYHLAAVFDDALQGVSHVVRGQDLFEATHIQRLLQALLDLPTPRYRHHPLLTDAQGRRFAKRDRAESLRELRARGVSPRELRAELGFD
ncbi:tRNA glutamyl-Q(34) synthetase GluQRS [Caulobacter sp. 17J80-11]|uniref:tRNA glutamyl-Q(34) synthetase GluQRS n=1 Tax=Caulobacter sp. 17J80-11 TaxID=2763502 RepID=UPI0016539D1C|nr:tRNA glutamyl-Q(34) synthetase GluQRS [Caulobacter sp. 17J80-11]MBC6980345.1 tRNA glutamyl-Q(34) synthetase GluQRS [Caulobacter sp. 17J80-11]